MIIANHSGQQTPQFRVLSDGQCHELYLATLECLQRVGVRVRNAEALELLTAAGAPVDGDKARIPAHLVQEALASAPRTFTLWGRDPSRAMHIAPDRVHFGPGLTSTYFIDVETGQRRRTRRGDPGLTARICDALEGMDYVMGLGLIGDVDPALAPVYEFAELIANTGKPIIAWAYRPENVADIHRMAVAVAGGEEALRRRPIYALFSTLEALQHTDEDLANVLWAVERGVPVVYCGGACLGLSAPASGAASLVVYLAGVLSGLVILQLKRRGAPVVLGGVHTAMDLRNARPAYGAPEMSLHSAAAADLARYLGIPFMGTAGASESKLLDAQAGVESSIQVLMSAMSGASLVHDVGFLDCADIASLPLLVLSDEIIAMVRRIMQGVAVNREAIMLDLIEEVGPGGYYIAEPQSAALCRSQVWVPTLMDRDPHVIWQEKGGKSTEERAQEKVRTLLRTHQPPPLTGEATAAIQAILAEAEARRRA